MGSSSGCRNTAAEVFIRISLLLFLLTKEFPAIVGNGKGRTTIAQQEALQQQVVAKRDGTTDLTAQRSTTTSSMQNSLPINAYIVYIQKKEVS
jgi:hypothetical protein